MTCKHCGEPIVENTVRKSPEPFVYHPYKHKFGNLIGCFDGEGNSRRTKAEPLKGDNNG